MPDVFRCFTVAFRCSQLFSNVLRILLIDYRCSIDIPRCVQDVFRCSKTFSDDHRCSWIFSRCSLDVLLMFKGKETYLRKCIFSSVSIGPRTKNQWGAMFISKISYLWNGLLHMFVESTIAMRRKIRFYELNWRNCSIIKWQAHLFCALKNILYTEASHANFHFDWWKLQNYKAEKKYFPTYRPLVLTDRHKIINFNNRKNEIKFERISWILPVSGLFRKIDLW